MPLNGLTQEKQDAFDAAMALAEQRRRSGWLSCDRCYKQKPATEFGKNYQADASTQVCKLCVNLHSLKSRHAGLTDQMIERIGKGCEICGSTEGVSIDHDHACCPNGKSCQWCRRGVLCRGCNTGLGYFRESTESLTKAVAYLDRWSQRTRKPL